MDQIASSPPPDRSILADDSSLAMLLAGPVPGIVRTLVHNLQQIHSRNFRTERPTLGIVYSRFVRDIDKTTREVILNAAVISIKTTELEPEALLTFIENDPSPDLVTQAVHSYLILGKAQFDEPLAALKDTLSMLGDPRIHNKGLILAGLITFGERRVCAAIRPYHSQFKVDTYKQLSSSVRATTLHRCTLDHLLNWLLEIGRTAEFKPALTEHVGYLTRTLTSLVMQNPRRPVEDMSFNFGRFAFPSFTESFSTDYQVVLVKFEPLLDTLETLRNPDINKLISILRNPVDAKSEHQNAPRRIQSHRRRSNDRRVLSIAPAIERREENRRMLQRRQLSAQR